VCDRPVVPEEDEVALVVQGDDAAALELCLMWEERRKQPTHRVTQPRVEVVQDNLREMLGGFAAFLEETETE
jgi:hypothetical protein